MPEANTRARAVGDSHSYAVPLRTARGQGDAIDVVDDARSGIECGKGVIVEQRITEGGRPQAC
jgi:hypothetical protein